MAPAAGLEPATRRLTGGFQPTQAESLRQDASVEVVEVVDRDARCFAVRQDDLSRNVTENRAECTNLPRAVVLGLPASHASAALPPPPAVAGEPLSTSCDALRLAIKLAVDAGEYERAAALLDVIRWMTPAPK